MTFSPEELALYLEQWRSSGLLPLIVIAMYVVGTLLFVPIVVLFLASAYLLPPLQAAVCSLAGIVASALVGYSLGRLGGNRILKRLPKKLLGKLRAKVSGREILSVAVIRKIPIAPFLVVNMALGAMGIPALHFALGTALGMTPAVTLIAIFDKSYESAMADPSSKTLVLVIVLTAAALLAAFFAQHYSKKNRTKRSTRGGAAPLSSH